MSSPSVYRYIMPVVATGLTRERACREAFGRVCFRVHTDGDQKNVPAQAVAKFILKVGQDFSLPQAGVTAGCVEKTTA